jgi:membrane protein YdbS with pleckstrin-like domain
MRLTPPKQITFWISLILGLLGVLSFVLTYFGVLGNYLATVGFVLLLVAYILIMLGLMVKGL